MTGFNPYSIPAILTLFCFLFLAMLTIRRALHDRLRRLFLAICAFGALLHIDIIYAFHSQSAEAALAVSRADHFFLVFSIPVYIQFFHTYLKIDDRKWLEWAAYGFAAALMTVTPTRWYIASMASHFFGYFARAGALFFLFGIGGLAVTVYALALLHRAIQAETEPGRKNRLKYLLLGFGSMGLLNGLNTLPVLGLEIYPPGNLSFIPLIVFAVGLFRHDLLDMGFLIEKSLVHSVVSALLTAGFALFLAAGYGLLKDVGAGDSIWFPTLVFFAAAMAVGPVRDRVKQSVDRRFFPRRYDFRRTLKSVSRRIVTVLDADRIARTIGAVVKQALQAESCAVFDRVPAGAGVCPLILQAPESHPMVRPEPAAAALLAQHAAQTAGPILRGRIAADETEGGPPGLCRAMDAVGAEVALPLPFSDRRAGLLLLGKRTSGRLYTPEDLDLLETLAGQAALALNNARSCRQLREMNRSLEQTVAERTRDLEAAVAEKERTLDQLIRSESLAAVGQLVAGVAHELNNPLASAKSLVQSVAEDLAGTGVETSAELVDDLQFVDRELGRARDIVSSLLGLSRQTQNYTEAVDLNAAVEDALRLLRNECKRLKIDLDLDLCPDLPTVEGNFSNLGQVVLNIVKNAVQAVGEDNGRIRLATHFESSAGQVVFSCSDSGPGVDPAVQTDIFKPFFTTKPPGQGTGLGLYLCHEVVSRHGGQLCLTPGDGPGACFTVRLPVNPPGDAAPGSSRPTFG